MPGNHLLHLDRGASIEHMTEFLHAVGFVHEPREEAARMAEAG